MPAGVPCGHRISSNRQLGSLYHDLVRPPLQASLTRSVYAASPATPIALATAAVHPIGWIHRRHSASRATTQQPPFHPQVSESCEATFATNGDFGRLPSNVSHRPRQAGWASHALLVQHPSTVSLETEDLHPSPSLPSHSTLRPKPSGMTTLHHQASRRPPVQPKPNR